MSPIYRFSGGFLKKRIENMRNVFLLTFLFLILTVIFTPLFVKRGTSFFSEETLEAVLLLVQVSISWNVFQLYERAVKNREKEIGRLEEEYREREKELLEAFAYVGKINVRMSLIKDFMKKLKAPESRTEVKENIEEILRMALSISGKKWITLRLIGATGLQTISEYWVKIPPDAKTSEIRIGNKELVKLGGSKKFCHRDGYCVVSSSGSKALDLRTFLIFEENNIDREILDFLSAAANQCEIIHSLFELRREEK